LDITTILMVFVCKYSSFAYAYQDGLLPPEKLSNEQKVHRIVALPNLIDYVGYIFFFGACGCGPSMEYSDFNKFINLEG